MILVEGVDERRLIISPPIPGTRKADAANFNREMNFDLFRSTNKQNRRGSQPVTLHKSLMIDVCVYKACHKDTYERIHEKFY